MSETIWDDNPVRPTTVDYRIIRDSTTADLEVAVLLLIAEGWRPLGGPYATVRACDGDFTHFQAMVKNV